MYYFAGNATDNWVRFGGFYWRIIRTNSDGGVRLLYHGTSPDTTSAYIGTSVFDSNYNDPMYSGYKYGTSGSLESNRTNTNDSTIKGVIDTWYKNNLNTNYGKYLSTTAVYCNDRSLGTGQVYNLRYDTFYYAAYMRTTEPTYDCKVATDAFSVNNTSAKLTYPVALMTLDEIIYAGGKYNTNLPSPYAWYYLNSIKTSAVNSTWWWLMSPFRYEVFDSDGHNVGNSQVVVVLGSSNPGSVGYSYTGNNIGSVRPVTSLKSCVKTSGGDGSATNPYTILETETGC